MADISELIKASIEGIKSFADGETIVGKIINTPSGVTIIPISKLTVGFVSGGLDYGQKKLSHVQNFGAGSGTGVSVTPIAFLTVTPDAAVDLIPVEKEKAPKLLSIIERSPDIIEKIKNLMS